MVTLARSVQEVMSSQIATEYRIARGGSRHLEFLGERKLMRITPSEILRIAYVQATMDKTLEELRQEVHGRAAEPIKPTSADPEPERLLLGERSGEVIADYLDCPEVAAEIKRAVWQIKRSLRAKQDLKEEKADIQAATSRST